MRWKTLLLLAFAAGLVLFIALYERHLPTTDERREASNQVFPFADGAFTGLDLADGDLRWTHRKEEGKWRLVAPLDYPADDLAVSGLHSTLVTLRKEKTLDPGADLKGLDLEPPAAVLKMETASGRATLVLGAEIPGSGRMAARWVEKGEAYFVGDNLRAALRKSVDELRDKAIFAADTAAVARMELTYPSSGKTASLWKGDAGWMLDVPFTDSADPEGVDKLLYSFSGLRAKAFIDDAEDRGLKALGLDPPTAIVAFYDRDKKPVLEAAVGRTPDLGPDEFHLKRGGQVFLVSAALWPNLERGMLTIPNPKLLAFHRWEVDRVEARTAERTVAAERSDDGWKVDGKALTDASPVYDLLDRLAALQWMENYKTPALGEEILTVVVTTEKGTAQAVFAADAGDPQAVWAAVADRSNYWKLETKTVEGLVEAAGKIR
jgi:hypothetical protein